MILSVIITLCSDLAGPFNRGNLVGADCLFEAVEKFKNSFFFSLRSVLNLLDFGVQQAWHWGKGTAILRSQLLL